MKTRQTNKAMEMGRSRVTFSK